MRILISASKAEKSVDSFITIDGNVPFEIVAAVAKAIADSAIPKHHISVEVDGPVAAEAAMPRSVTSGAVYEEPAKLALDAITTQPVVHPNPTPSFIEPPTSGAPVVELYNRDAMRKLQEKMLEDAQGDNKFTGTEMPPSPAQKAAQDALALVKPEILTKAAGEKVSSIQELAAKLPADNPLVQAITPAPEAPKQRKRKTAEEHPEDAMINIPLVSANADIPQSQPAATLPAQPVEPPKVEKKLKPEEEKEIRARLGKYRNEILPAGKMEPITGIGGVEAQLKAFVQKFYPDKPTSKTWDYADWVYLLSYFDGTVENLGPEGLVKVMQQKIGARA